MSETEWQVPNANVRVGSLIKVSLSDAPVFTATVLEIQEDDRFGASFKIAKISTSHVSWISEARIVAVAVNR